ncbi:MAG TPA: spore coat protein [candidate division Zixibacteria bacterium]|nr:spore coat protein [candidate division Zixibacteria bacterium]
MKGVVLAGGLGTRLHPLTKITNKHLLPVYDEPMIYYPIKALVEAGIEDIMIVCGGNHAGEFLRLLGNGREFGLKHLNYTYQEKEGGIAEALGLCEHFVDGDKVVVFLGDNIIGESLVDAVREFEKQDSGARILLKEVEDPRDYGVARFDEEGNIVEIIEKPKDPPSNYAVVGIYMYDSEVFDIIKTLKPSARGELEITDVNNAYLRKGKLKYSILQGFWADAGASIEAYYQTIRVVREFKLKQKAQQQGQKKEDEQS